LGIQESRQGDDSFEAVKDQEDLLIFDYLSNLSLHGLVVSRTSQCHQRGCRKVFPTVQGLTFDPVDLASKYIRNVKTAPTGQGCLTHSAESRDGDQPLFGPR